MNGDIRVSPETRFCERRVAWKVCIIPCALPPPVVLRPMPHRFLALNAGTRKGPPVVPAGPWAGRLTGRGYFSVRDVAGGAAGPEGTGAKRTPEQPGPKGDAQR